jgi:YHS domain-containing protein
MLRFVVILLVAILLISLLRSVIGILVKGFAHLTSAGGGSPAQRPVDPQTSSELKKDPVCGTYVPAATSVKKLVGGSVLHFCSESCRDKYRG